MIHKVIYLLWWETFLICYYFHVVCFQGAKQRMTELEKKGKSYMQLRKIKQFDEDFDTKVFPDEAQDIYIKANKLLEK